MSEQLLLRLTKQNSSREMYIFTLDCFTSSPCLSSSLLPSSFIIFYLLTPDEDSLLKALVFNCFLCFII